MKRRLYLISLVFITILLGVARVSALARQPTPDLLPRGEQARMQSSLTPSPTVPPTITPTNSPPAPPPSALPTVTETPGPYAHTIQTGDTCISIAYEYGHVSLDVLSEIARLNNLQSCSYLPGPGATILVPRPTFTPTPFGGDMTQTAVATSAPPNVTLQAGPSFALQPYTVKEGDTLSSIAIDMDSSLQQICELNPLPNGIDCGGCQWESPNCCCPRAPQLSIGQQLNVPAPTPTPTYTPTFTGSETPTATPTYRAPLPVYPSAGATVAGPVRLSWMTVGVLGDKDSYLVVVRDETTGTLYSHSTRQLSLDLPAEYLPADGQSRTFAWQVSVVQLGSDGLFYPLGGVVAEQRFTWTGWQ